MTACSIFRIRLGRRCSRHDAQHQEKRQSDPQNILSHNNLHQYLFATQFHTTHLHAHTHPQYIASEIGFPLKVCELRGNLEESSPLKKDRRSLCGPPRKLTYSLYIHNGLRVIISTHDTNRAVSHTIKPTEERVSGSRGRHMRCCSTRRASAIVNTGSGT